jgi:hypothetical protein
MNPVIRNIIAVIAGLLIGGAVNMSLIMISGSIIPPPEGADITTMEGLKSSMHLFQPRHFVFPFLAHAAGTFTGAFVAALFAANNKLKFALAIGVFFLLGGIINVVALPSPIWFSVLDLVAAYIPVSYLAGKIVSNLKFNKTFKYQQG